MHPGEQYSPKVRTSIHGRLSCDGGTSPTFSLIWDGGPALSFAGKADVVACARTVNVLVRIPEPSSTSAEPGPPSPLWARAWRRSVE